jgi:hypothetical protein
MRTQEQIVNKIKMVKAKDQDWMGTISGDLITYLEFNNAKQFLSDKYIRDNKICKENWVTEINEKDHILNEMKEYMSFAWDKANDFRGLSASRSMDHYTAWIWLLGDEDYFGDLGDYKYYGKDNLKKICDKYGWDSKQWDDGVRLNEEPNYDAGYGR